jgi:5'(3')-deoxyribonucleotidase
MIMGQPLEHIFLDMDGVLTDFVSATVRLHGQPDVLQNWPPGERDIPQVLHVSRTHYWNLIDAQGADFWASLEPFPWFADLVALVREFAPMTILTSPSLAPTCLDGKVQWLYSHFPKEQGRRFTDYLMGRQKHLLAQPRRVLIDDAEANVEDFRAAGGHAILFPQPWNANYAIQDRLAYVKSELLALCQNS